MFLMTDEDPKSRRTRSVSLTLQSVHDDGCVHAADVFISKRFRGPSIICVFCRYIDPVFWISKLLKLILQHSFTFIEMSHRSIKSRCNRCFENLRRFLLSYPPMVLFTLSISLFALLLTLLAVYVMKTRRLNEVDISKDWNVFLQSFSDLEFCVIQDNSTQAGSPLVDAHRSLDSTVVRTVSVLMSLTIQPTKDFLINPHNNLHLSASMNAKYIGFKGSESGTRHWINMTTIVSYRFNASSCSNIPLQGCETVELDACMELTGPPDVFPHSKHSPKTCLMPSLSGVDFWGKLNWQTIDFESFYYCRSRTMIGMRHEDDPRLFQLLRNPHRNVIRQHLLRTSFFLYVYVSIVVIYAMAFDHAKQRFLQPDNQIYDF